MLIALARSSGSADEAIPQALDVFSAIATQHPERAPELLLAASVWSSLQAFGTHGEELTSPTEGSLEAYELRSPSVVAAARALGSRLSGIRVPQGSGFALRVLQIGFGPATSEAFLFAAEHGARVTVLDLDAPRLERARLKYGQGSDASFCGNLDALPDLGFDLVVSAGGLSRLAGRGGAFGSLVKKCAADALIMAVEPVPSFFRELALGLAEGEEGDQRELRLTAAAWESECLRAGLVQIDARLVDTGADQAVALSARSTDQPERSALPGPVSLVCAEAQPGSTAAALFDAIASLGAACRFVDPSALATLRTGSCVWIAGGAEREATARVTAHCLALRDIAGGLAHAKVKLFVVVPASDSPVAEAILSFVQDRRQRISDARYSAN